MKLFKKFLTKLKFLTNTKKIKKYIKKFLIKNLINYLLKNANFC